MDCTCGSKNADSSSETVVCNEEKSTDVISAEKAEEIRKLTRDKRQTTWEKDSIKRINDWVSEGSCGTLTIRSPIDVGASVISDFAKRLHNTYGYDVSMRADTLPHCHDATNGICSSLTTLFSSLSSTPPANVQNFTSINISLPKKKKNVEQQPFLDKFSMPIQFLMTCHIIIFLVICLVGFGHIHFVGWITIAWIALNRFVRSSEEQRDRRPVETNR